jgi:hypothetical protein
MKAYRYFNLIVLGLTLPSLLGIGLLNAAIDPYGVIDSPKVAGVNKSKPEIVNRSRLFKALEVMREEPTIIVLGTSRTEVGIDPDHPVFTKEQSAYNLGLAGGTMYEAKRYFQHALVNQPELEQVVIGLDFFMFNGARVKQQIDFNGNRLEKTSPPLNDVISSTLSVVPIKASAETIVANINQTEPTAYYRDNGSIARRHPPDQSILETFQSFLATEYSRYYKDYTLSQERLSDLETIVNICKQQGIEVKLFISPSHAAQWEAIRAAGLWPVFEEWKRELVKIAPVWDFSGYNSITTEPISDQTKNYFEASHYRNEVGDLVLNRMYSHREEEVPPDFGTLLTPETIESHLDKINTDRKSWVKDNPDVVQWVQELAE